MTQTDFRNRKSVATLLFELQYIFSEFKKHEEIEDEHIVNELRQRMVHMMEETPDSSEQAAAKSCKPDISLERDMHGDDRLASVIHVISKVTDVTRQNACTPIIRLRQGQRLCEVLDEFTVDFVPHMAEEEQVCDVQCCVLLGYMGVLHSCWV